MPQHAVDQAPQGHAGDAGDLVRELSALRAELDVARGEAGKAIEETARIRVVAEIVSRQRDVARLALRRAGAVSEGARRTLIAEFEGRIAESENIWEAKANIWQAKAADLEQQADAWRTRYDRLRQSLEAILRPFGIPRLWRSLPPALRRKLRGKLLKSPER